MVKDPPGSIALAEIDEIGNVLAIMSFGILKNPQ